MPRFSPLWMLRAALLAAAAAAGACGGDAPDSPDATGSSTPVPVRGAERIGWDQSAPNADALAAYTFTVFVDNVPRPLPAARCEPTAGAEGYPCSAPLPPMAPGRHELRLSASADGQESGRSERLIVDVGSPLEAAAAGVAPTDLRAVCLETPAAGCYEGEVLASGLGRVSWLVASGDRDLLFVEDGVRVRMVKAGRLLQAAAFDATESSARIVGLAPAPDFERTRLVLAALAREERPGRHSATVTRFRELAGVFGEQAALITLPAPPELASLPMAVDIEGAIYVALQAFTDDARRAGGPLNGKLLRFAPDGTAGPGAGSPVFAHGYERPSGLLFGPAGRLWLSGRDQRWPHVVSSIAPDSDRRIEPPVPHPELLWPDGALPPGDIALASAAGSGAPAFIAYGGAGFRVVSDGRRIVRLDRLRIDPPGEVTSIAVGPGGDAYLAVLDASNGSRLLRLPAPHQIETAGGTSGLTDNSR